VDEKFHNAAHFILLCVMFYLQIELYRISICWWCHVLFASKRF